MSGDVNSGGHKQEYIPLPPDCSPVLAFAALATATDPPSGARWDCSTV